MGEVWLATASGPSGFSKKLVLKTILPNLAVHRDYVQMLVDEASVCAEMAHPNLVKVFDFGCVGRTYFIAMEYLPGRTLAQLMQRVIADHESRVPAWLAASLIAQCCDGLQYAHDFADEEGTPLGLVHRDISPSNVMVCFTGNAAILDFGVAATQIRMASEDRTVLKGKYAYMAPERIRGEVDDRRGDIFALGVVMYQMLTAQRPFQGDSDLELFEDICAANPPRPRQLAPWLPDRIEEILMRAIAGDADKRYQQARQLADDLRSFLRDSSQDHAPHDVSMFVASHFSDASDLPASMRPGLRTEPSAPRHAEDLDELLVDVPAPGVLSTDEPSVEVSIEAGSPEPVASEESEPIDIFTTHSRRLRETSEPFAHGSSSSPKPIVDTEPAFFGARLAPRTSEWWGGQKSEEPRPRARTTEDS